LTGEQLEAAAKPFLRIGKDSCLWGEPVQVKSVVLAVANRADLIVNFHDLFGGGPAQAYYLVNTMPQFDGRGPKAKLDDGGDPRVLPLPFDVPGRPPVPELDRPIALVKFVVGPQSEEQRAVPQARVRVGVPLAPVRPPIPDADVKVVREFVFERGKGAWQVNGRFYDPAISNACPDLVMTDTAAEEWVLRNGGGGWWHPIHIHLESHQLISYEKDFAADESVDPADPPPLGRLARLEDVTSALPRPEIIANHDTQILGPNTVVRIRMRFRTWPGPFVFHCHNLEHEDMRMMQNFEPVPGPAHNPSVAPAARTHGNEVTLNGRSPEFPEGRVGELDSEQPAVPGTPVKEFGEPLIEFRPRPKPST
jgi:FtsP/CotA-like multicopper oxidase with cupredoxin domain